MLTTLYGGQMMQMRGREMEQFIAHNINVMNNGAHPRIV